MSKGRLIAGIIVIIIGGLFLLNNTVESINLGSVFQFWPLILIILGVALLIKDRLRSLFGPLILIVIGGLFLISNLEILSISQYWPALLILIGLAIIIGGFRRKTRRQRSPSASVIDASPNSDDNTNDATLSSANRTINGAFKNDHAKIVMGSLMLDMRNAHIPDKPATLDISIVMGEAKIRLPSEWNVQITSTATMGESKDTRSSSPTSSDHPDLIITGSVVMGSLKIED